MQRSRVIPLVTVAFIAGGGAFACRASVQADAKANVKGDDDEGAYLDEPIESGSGETSDPAAARVGLPALLGARHDLRPSPNLKTATCQCVAIALGQPNDTRMTWHGTPPSIDPETQLVIALSSEGISCPGAPADSLGASYWGYKQRGDDVIVIVEAAREGRPITMGAIIPKPFGSGQVYVEPSLRGLVYGKSLGGGGACKLGNPGRARSRETAPAVDDSTPEVDFSD